MKYECLKLEERRIIEEMYAKGAKPGEIAERVGKCQATIYRELERGKTGETDSRFRQGYSAAVAEARVNRPFLLNSFSAFQARAVLATEAIIRSPPSAIRAYASVARAFFPHSATSAAGRPSHHSGLSRSGRRQSSQSAAEHEEQ